MERKIIHVDMDAFFASVEERDNPLLRGKPVIIGALPGTRGVVSTCNYEARKYGVHSAMNIKDAYKMCPNGVFLLPDMHKYSIESQKVHKIMESYTDIIEYVSLDEGYMDVTASEKLFGDAERIGRELKKRVFEETGLSCSVGIGYSMIAAKTASEENKPDGFFIIPDQKCFAELMKNRPVSSIYGIGKKTAQRLISCGFSTVSDLQNAKKDDLSFLGKSGENIIKHSKGIDEREIIPNNGQKSVGREFTFQTDLTSKEEIEEFIHIVSRKVSDRLKYMGLKGKTVTLKIKYSDMTQITRAKTGGYTNSAKEICLSATELLGKVEFKKSVRLVGVSVSNMEGEEEFFQLSFEDIQPEDRSKQNFIDDMIFSINKNMGSGALKTGKELLAERVFRKMQNEREEK